MRTLVQRQASCCSAGGPQPCAACERAAVQRSARASTSPAHHAHVPPVVRQALRSPGEPLDARTRAALEPRLGFDFATVRVHADALAAESARAIDARAYTIGRDVFFARDAYRPQTHAGAALLRHELAHVVQQDARDFSGGLPADARISAPGDPLEVQAERGVAPTRGQAHAVARQVAAAPPPAAPASTTVFHPGVNHDHRPSGRWADVQAAPNSGFWENQICAHMEPSNVVNTAIVAEFSAKPIALAHLLFYRWVGAGADFPENANLDHLLRTDASIQQFIGAMLPSTPPASGTFATHVKVEQSDYTDQDLRYAFGAIDRLDIEVDYAAGTVHAWFQDRYEWHPVYPFYGAQPGDVVRETNCVHAALVELKSGSARDFWMKGEATVPLSLFPRPAVSAPGSTL